MNRLAFLLVALPPLLLAAPALAQPAANWWAPASPQHYHDRYEDGWDDDDAYEDGWEEGRYDDRYEGRYDDDRRHRNRRGGPPFCRSGAGHPVHGWAWCVRKGYAPAPRYRRPPPYRHRRYRHRPPHYRRRYPEAPRRWRRHNGTSIRFHLSYERFGRWGGVLTRAEIDLILDRRTRDYLRAYRRHLGIRTALEGRWVRARGATTGRVLQLRAGAFPLAELADWNGDRRVDAAWLYDGPRRYRSRR